MEESFCGGQEETEENGRKIVLKGGRNQLKGGKFYAWKEREESQWKRKRKIYSKGKEKRKMRKKGGKEYNRERKGSKENVVKVKQEENGKGRVNKTVGKEEEEKIGRQ